MSQITFKGTVLEGFYLGNNFNGIPYVDVEFSADWTKPVSEEMEWGDAPDGFLKSNLAGKLSASKIIVTPIKADQKNSEIDVAIVLVSKFHYTPEIDKKNGTVKHRRISFVARSHKDGVCALLEVYRWAVGDHRADAVVTYRKAVQGELDLGNETPRGRKRAAAK